MSLNKNSLRDALYSDLAQEDVVITDETTDNGVTKRGPDDYFLPGD